MTLQPSRISERMISAAASELASQEKYNPNWVKVEDWTDHRNLYERRARLILEAALAPATTTEEENNDGNPE